MTVNQHLQIGLLRGFAAAGANIHLLIEPVKEINDKMTLYVDVLLSTTTDSSADWMSIHLAPNLDIMLSETMVISGGNGVNVYDGLIRIKILLYSLALIASL